jgi:membrane fusion protein, macrolide-specific efflux system
VIWAGAGAIATGFFLFYFILHSPVPQYRTTPVTRENLDETILATGVLQPIRQVDVGTRVTGQMKTLRVKLGDHVRQGDLVAEIDPTVPENELRVAQAHLANLEAQQRAVDAKLRRSKLELDRQRAMMREATTSRRDLEAADAQSRENEASLAALNAQISQARSQIEIANANLAYTKITAPIEGEVVGVLTQQGQTVVAAQIVPVILKLARLDAMTVRTQIPEAEVIHVRVGQPVTFTIMGDPDKRYSGKLRAVELAPQNYSDSPQNLSATASSSSMASSGAAAVFYNALFDVPNPDRLLRIGITAQVSITLGVSRGALTIPTSLLHDQLPDGRYSLRVLRASGQVEDRQIRVGVNNHLRVEVLEGLKEGEEVVIGDLSTSPGGNDNGSGR